MRLAAGIEYDGSGFYGWQRQRQSPTVQECLEQALGQVANHPVAVHSAGRTDTGVHACCQVVHFDTSAHRSEHGWVLGCNTGLEAGISVLWVRPVSDDFHARFSAVARRYRYRIINRRARPAIERQRAAWVRVPLDADAMHEAAQSLVGEHDFSSFRASGCQARTPVRRIHSVSVQRHGNELVIDIEANAFVYHMVRNIAGTLIMIGRGDRPTGWLTEVLQAADRRLAGPTAPSQGLYFVEPVYPPGTRLPIGAGADFPQRGQQA